MAKTWEMIRDIQPGEVWECSNAFEYYKWEKLSVRLDEPSGGIRYNEVPKAVGDVGNYVKLYPFVVHILEWRKTPKLVDFVEAMQAFVNGKVIRPYNDDQKYNMPTDVYSLEGPYSHCAFATKDIRGKWEILEE
jgi:hypothetical protein